MACFVIFHNDKATLAVMDKFKNGIAVISYLKFDLIQYFTSNILNRHQSMRKSQIISIRNFPLDIIIH